MSTKVVTWNGISSATIPELVIGKVQRKMIGDNRTILREIPGREGSIPFGERPGMREFRMECYVQALTFVPGRRDAVTEVADWLDVEGQAALTISDEPGVYYEAVLGDPPDPDEWREVGTFEIRFKCQPYALDTNVTTRTVNGDADFVDSWDPGITSPVFPVIEITPTNGTLTGFEFTMNGETLVWSGALADDETLTLNSISAVVLLGASGDVMLTGAYDPANLSMSGLFGSFPELVPGVNNWQFVSTGGTATAITVEISYRKRYRK